MQENKAVVKLGTAHFQEANEKVRQALESKDIIELHEVFAQRYLGCAMSENKRLEIYGTPGNDMACYMDGGEIEVFGNAQDQIGNTMNAGTVVIHGRCGDAAGYSMRGGAIFVRDDCGWRVGIHMKQYEDKCPTIVIGGNAGQFLGEYMAGGIIVLMGKPGPYLASGMHGGVIYLQHALSEEDIPDGLIQSVVSENDRAVLSRLISQFEKVFPEKTISATVQSFYSLRPFSTRPYEKMYA